MNSQTNQTAQVDMVTIKVDGKTYSVPKTVPNPVTGKLEPTTIIRACGMVGVDIPHFCFHPRLPVSGNCRMCLVEYGMPAVDRVTRKPILNEDGTQKITKMPRPAIACATPVSPGMEIYTTTENVRQYRQAVLEFLLLNHPLDCPICDQAGSCALQEYVHQYGQDTSRFVERKTEKLKHRAISSKIVLDNERCVLCTRCVRFNRDIVGKPFLGILGRGGQNYISPYPGTDFEHNYTLNSVDLCPVGALTSRDFRFRMRNWFLKSTKSICPGCATGCNIYIDSREGQIYRLRPRENDAVNNAWMCDNGRLNYKWIGDSSRLTRVVCGYNGGRQFVGTLQNVIEQIADELTKSAHKGATAMLISGRLSTEEIYLASLIAKHIGAVTDSSARSWQGDTFLMNDDMNPNSKAIEFFGVAAKPAGSNIPMIAEKIEKGQIRNLICIGENPLKMGIERSLLGRLELFVVCDVLKNEATEVAQVILPGAAFAEKEGTFISAKGRLQRFEKAIEPPLEAMPDWWILSKMLSAMTKEKWGETAEEIFDKMASRVSAFAGMTWEGIGSAGVMLKNGMTSVEDK